MRLLAILLLMLMVLPMASPLLALQAGKDDHLPACCRRNGKHQCNGMVGTGDSTDLATRQHNHVQIRATMQKCPMFPQGSVATPHDVATPPASREILASLISHPTGTAQTESRWRVSRYRSRQKRGPPAIFFL
jgi:hypothetical protein